MPDSLLSNAMNLYNNRGILYLILAAIDYASYRSKYLTIYLFDRYYDIINGKNKININGVSAEFDASRSHGGNNIRHHLNEEYDQLEDLVENIREDDVFYDIGANVGLYSHLAGQICSEIIAFEPYPPNYHQLENTLSKTPAEVEIFQLALSDTAGQTQFSATGDTGRGNGGIGMGEMTVETARGDDIISKHNLNQPDIVKIDVEGAEGLVIDGMRDALTHARRIYCEIHLPGDNKTAIDTYGTDLMDILTVLNSLGFDIELQENRGTKLQVVGVDRE